MTLRVLIDGDACPVVAIAVRLAGSHGLPCLIFCDSAHLLAEEGAEVVLVEQGRDHVDFRLVNEVESGDLVLTQDYGLAAMCLARRAFVLDQNGREYHAGNIDGLLAARAEAARIRRGGGRLRGPHKRRAEQDEAFAAGMEALILRETAKP